MQGSTVVDITGLVIAAVTLLATTVASVVAGAWIVGNKIGGAIGDMRENIIELTGISKGQQEMLLRHENQIGEHSEIIEDWRVELRAKQMVDERDKVAGRINKSGSA